MTRPMITIHNVETGEIQTREMNDVEFARYETDQVEFSAQKAKAQAKAEAKLAAQTKLAALGLTVQDLQALGL